MIDRLLPSTSNIMTNLNRLYIPETTEALVFDLDDTCQASISPKVQQYLDTAKMFGVSEMVTLEKIRLEWLRNPYPKLVEVLFGDELYERVMKHLGENYDRYPKELFPETVATLKALGASGLRLGAVTSVPTSIVERDARATGVIWRDLFEYVQTADATDFHKPDGRVFDPTKRWLGSTGVNNSENVIYLGDGIGDVLSARDAGFGFIGVERGFMTSEDFEKAGVPSIPSLCSLIS